MPPFKEASQDSLVACRHTTHAIDFRVKTSASRAIIEAVLLRSRSVGEE